MAAVDHWHPILCSSEVSSKPVGAVFAGGVEVVVFRSANNQLGAIEDRCAHRRMRLSRGWVHEGRLVCPYHGWNYSCDGVGKSPCDPTLKSRVKSFDVKENYGAIWIRKAEGSGVFPDLGVEGYAPVFTLRYQFRAPLELVVDNFAEIEHSVTTHFLLAYDAKAILKTDCIVQVAADHIRITNRGPQRRVPALLRQLIGYGADDLFIGEGLIKFSPLHLRLENYWINPHTGAKRSVRMTGAVFFNPISPDITDIMLFGFSSSQNSAIGRFFKKYLLRTIIQLETRRDIRMVEGIADKNPSLAGMRLGRFDRPLSELRKKISTVYWGMPDDGLAAQSQVTG